MIVTKKGSTWELKDSSTWLVSVLWVLPLPLHFFPLGFIIRGVHARVRSLVAMGLVLALADGLAFAGFSTYTDTGLYPDTGREMLCLAAMVLLYVFGIVLLTLQNSRYLERKYLVKGHGAPWVSLLPPMQVVVETTSVRSNSELFVDKLMHLRSNIENEAIQANIDRMVSLFSIISQKDQVSAEKFLVVHATVVNVLTQYDDLENARLDNAVAVQSKKQLEGVIEKATLAFEQELTNRFKTEIMEVSAETDAYLQQLKNKNLID